MKKIVPFNNTLEFSTDVKEITAISLEHEIHKNKDIISGVFYINGEYKITEGVLEKEIFNFELPFDIALSDNYKEETLIIDIDDFRYELIKDKTLKVNIDLYIDGEIEEEPVAPPEEIRRTSNAIVVEELPINDNVINQKELESPKEDRVELLQEMLTEHKEENMPTELNITNQNINENANTTNTIFNTGTNEETYVTYRVYQVLENDNLDTILTKYNITKEILSEYNDIENIKQGDKLIIPTDEK